VKSVTIHTDGGCQGNPGPGAWAAVLRHSNNVREIVGSELATTNNRMELRAAIEALNTLKEPCAVELFTDSEYLRTGITTWIKGWKARGWVTQEKKPVKNADLWRTLDAMCLRHQVKWGWLKGHAGHADNERCDVLAGEAMASLRQKHSAAELAQALEQFKSSTSSRSAVQPTLL